MKTTYNILGIVLTLALAAACTNDDLNSPDPARTPLAITEIGIGGSNLNASPATRIATDPASGAQAWEEGDAIRVFATLKDGIQAPGATLNPDGTITATSTYIYKVGSGWTQTPATGETTLYVDDVQTVDRVETYGGRTLYNPATDYLMQADPGEGGNPSTTGNPGTAAGSGTYTPGDNYRLNDLLADDSPVLGSSTNGSPARNSLSATLAHRRIDLVLRVADGAVAPSVHALPAGAYLLVTISGNRTITAWFAGKKKDEDSASPTAGKEVSTFRAIVEPEDVPGINVDNATGAAPTYTLPAGPHKLGTLVYPDPATAREKQLRVLYTLSATADTPLEAGERIVINATFMHNVDQLSATSVSIGSFEDGNGPNGEPIVTGQTAYGDGLQPLNPDVFNAERTTWVVSGGGTDETDATVLQNVRDALDRLDRTDPTNQGRIDLVLSDVGKLPMRDNIFGALDEYVQLHSVSAPRVTEIGRSAFYNCSALTAVSLPRATGDIGNYTFYGCEKLQTIDLPEVTGSIGRGAFNICKALTTVSLPLAAGRRDFDDGSGAGTIGLDAFNGCTSLQTVSIPKATGDIGKRAFSRCGKLTDISLPEATGSIGESAFNDCYALTTLSLPKVAGSIGMNAFYGCKALTTVSLPLAAGESNFSGGEGMGTIAPGTFGNCTSLQTVSLPRATGDIGNRAFQICEKLTDISLPEATGSIGESAFNGCSALTTVNLPKVAGSIGTNAFYHCTALTTISLPLAADVSDFSNGSGAGTIGAFAFDNCTSLKTVHLPLAKGDIGPRAFHACKQLTDISLPKATGDIGEEAFNDCNSLQTVSLPKAAGGIGPKAFFTCNALTSVSLPLATGGIGMSAFRFCTQLQTVTLPAITGSIGPEAFGGCWMLQTVSLPKATGDIGAEAFKDLSQLETVDLKSIAGSIGESAFSGCKKLEEVELPLATGDIGMEAFAYCSSLKTVKLPKVTRVGDGIFQDSNDLTELDLSGVTSVGEFRDRAFENFGNSQNCTLKLNPALYDDDAVVTSSVPAGTKDTFRGLVWKSIKSSAPVNP